MHRPNRTRFLFIARGSVNELEHRIDVPKERELLSADAAHALPEPARTINGLIRVRQT
jgi:hypothetical protein